MYRLAVLVTIAMCLKGAGASTTIAVDFDPYASVWAAATAEESVNWRDADERDDTVCTEAFAALELQRCLGAITGRVHDFAIVDDNAPLRSGDLLIVGGPESNQVAARLARFGPAPEADLPSEGYRIVTRDLDGRRVTVLERGSRVGTLYAAYDLLHRLGVRWLSPGEAGTGMPRLGLARLPVLDVSERPAMDIRGFHAWENRGDEDLLLWMARNRLNYWCVEQEQRALMHKLGIRMACGGHVLQPKYIAANAAYPYDHPRWDGDDERPTDPYSVSDQYLGDADGDGVLRNFEAHPEWYALRDGKRSANLTSEFGDNFCTSNADAMAEFTKRFIDDLSTGEWADADVVNAWALDVGKWCECDACKALGSPTDRNLLLVDAMAKAVREAQRDGRINRPVTLLFLAYADVIEPPTRPLPADFDYDMCVATFFPIVRCYVHEFDDPTCAKNADFLRNLRGWATDPERHYRGRLCIGEYYNVSGYKCLPVCYKHTMENDIPFYRSVGATDFHYMHCTTRNWGNKALTNYQMARQLWDPETDCEALWTDYFAKRYPGAEGEMRTFYESLERMLCNVSELKYGLARRLNAGAEDLFPGDHLSYGPEPGEKGPSLTEMLEEARRARTALEAARAKALPPRIEARIAEDERLFTYGERTLRFYDALSRSYAELRAGSVEDARAALAEAQAIAEELRADTTSTRYASSHANAENALEASFAAGALTRLAEALGEEG